MQKNDIITFGCRLNAYESEVIRGHLEASGQQGTVVINSCAVTAEAERQLRQTIRKLRRERPEARIVLTGCAAQINPAKYAAMEEIDLVLGNEEKLKADSYQVHGFIPSLSQPSTSLRAERSNPGPQTRDDGHSPNFGVASTERVQVNDIMSVKETALHLVESLPLPPGEASSAKNRDVGLDFSSRRGEGCHPLQYPLPKSRAFIQVQNGCNHRCTFCIIPYGRGNSRSVPMGEIVSQVRELVSRGYKEVVITGVDISDYGSDLPGTPTLGQMLRRLLALVPELPRLRLSSIDAVEVDDDLLRLIAEEPRLMPHLHVSLQSGDDMILKRMKRRHLRSHAIDFCRQVKDLRPDMVFGADIIAGFPTETDAMFENSLRIVDECDLTWLHVFPYSERPGTPAAKMPQVAKPVRKERAAILREKGEARARAFLHSQIGKTVSVLTETDGMGHTEHFAPVALPVGVAPGALLRGRVFAVADSALRVDLLP